MVSISGLDRADVLAALYNASKPQGLGILHFESHPMTRDEAASLLSQSDSFDYLKGRVMKISIPDGATEIYPGLYDRDLGDGACERAIAKLRTKQPA